MPGSIGTKMFATCFKKACNAPVCRLDCRFLFCFATCETSSVVASLAMPVIAENDSSTLFTLPGPNTICSLASIHA